MPASTTDIINQGKQRFLVKASRLPEGVFEKAVTWYEEAVTAFTTEKPTTREEKRVHRATYQQLLEAGKKVAENAMNVLQPTSTSEEKMLFWHFLNLIALQLPLGMKLLEEVAVEEGLMASISFGTKWGVVQTAVGILKAQAWRRQLNQGKSPAEKESQDLQQVIKMGHERLQAAAHFEEQVALLPIDIFSKEAVEALACMLKEGNSEPGPFFAKLGETREKAKQFLGSASQSADRLINGLRAASHVLAAVNEAKKPYTSANRIGEAGIARLEAAVNQDQTFLECFIFNRGKFSVPQDWQACLAKNVKLKLALQTIRRDREETLLQLFGKLINEANADTATLETINVDETIAQYRYHQNLVEVDFSRNSALCYQLRMAGITLAQFLVKHGQYEHAQSLLSELAVAISDDNQRFLRMGADYDFMTLDAFIKIETMKIFKHACQEEEATSAMADKPSEIEISEFDQIKQDILQLGLLSNQIKHCLTLHEHGKLSLDQCFEIYKLFLEQKEIACQDYLEAIEFGLTLLKRAALRDFEEKAFSIGNNFISQICSNISNHINDIAEKFDLDTVLQERFEAIKQSEITLQLLICLQDIRLINHSFQNKKEREIPLCNFNTISVLATPEMKRQAFIACWEIFKAVQDKQISQLFFPLTEARKKQLPFFEEAIPALLDSDVRFLNVTLKSLKELIIKESDQAQQKSLNELKIILERELGDLRRFGKSPVSSKAIEGDWQNVEKSTRPSLSMEAAFSAGMRQLVQKLGLKKTGSAKEVVSAAVSSSRTHSHRPF